MTKLDETQEITFDNTTVRNVFHFINYLLGELGILPVDPEDDIRENSPRIKFEIFPMNNRIVIQDRNKNYSKTILDTPVATVKDVIIITGYQLQFDTVQVSFQYIEMYETFVLELVKDLREKFSSLEHPKEPVILKNKHSSMENNPEKEKNVGINELASNLSDKQKKIDVAIMKWVTRNENYFGHTTMEDFLSDCDKPAGVFLSKSEFKRALQKACKRGLIEKGENGRYRPVKK